MENYSLSDIKAATGGDSMFGGNGIWFLALLFLFGGGGFGWSGRDGRYATVEDLNNSANFTRLESQVAANGVAISNLGTNLGNGICQLGYQLATDFGSLEKEIAECCCNTQRAVDSVKFDMANYASAINANVTAQVQSIKDMISQDKIATLQNQVNQMYLANQLCGIVRYPLSATYNAGYPFSNCGCSCGCTNI